MSALSELLAKIAVVRKEKIDGASGDDDLAARLDLLASRDPDLPDWRESIADLMRLVGADSSYGVRKALAIELGYPEERILTQGSAEMNRWLTEELKKHL